MSDREPPPPPPPLAEPLKKKAEDDAAPSPSPPPPAAPSLATDWDDQDVALPELGRGGAGPRWRGTITLTVILLLVLGGGALFYFLRHRPLQQRHARAEARLEELESTKAGLDDRVAALEEDLEDVRAERDRLQVSHDELQQRVEAREARIERLEGAQHALREQLEEEIDSGQVHITGSEGELAVGLTDEILFPPGGTRLSEDGEELLRRVAGELAGLEGQVIRVGGHTDDQPLSRKLRRELGSNWELSTRRATNVVRFLNEECDIAGERLMAAGFSQHRPAASNDTSEGRRRNRRIELTLLPADALDR